MKNLLLIAALVTMVLTSNAAFATPPKCCFGRYVVPCGTPGSYICGTVEVPPPAGAQTAQ